VTQGNERQMLVVLDGFDEIGKHRANIIGWLRAWLRVRVDANVIITTRPTGVDDDAASSGTVRQPISGQVTCVDGKRHRLGFGVPVAWPPSTCTRIPGLQPPECYVLRWEEGLSTDEGALTKGMPHSMRELEAGVKKAIYGPMDMIALTGGGSGCKVTVNVDYLERESKGGGQICVPFIAGITVKDSGEKYSGMDTVMIKLPNGDNFVQFEWRLPYSAIVYYCTFSTVNGPSAERNIAKCGTCGIQPGEDVQELTVREQFVHELSFNDYEIQPITTDAACSIWSSAASTDAAGSADNKAKPPVNAAAAAGGTTPATGTATKARASSTAGVATVAQGGAAAGGGEDNIDGVETFDRVAAEELLRDLPQDLWNRPLMATVLADYLTKVKEEVRGKRPVITEFSILRFVLETFIAEASESTEIPAEILHRELALVALEKQELAQRLIASEEMSGELKPLFAAACLGYLRLFGPPLRGNEHVQLWHMRISEVLAAEEWARRELKLDLCEACERAVRESWRRPLVRFLLQMQAVLNLDLSSLEQAGIDMLAEHLPGCSALRSLTLGGLNNEKLKSVDKIGKAIRSLKLLTRLTLSVEHCMQLSNLGEVGVSLGRLTSLTMLTLNFAYCSQLMTLGKKGSKVEHLGKGLAKLTALTDLTLNFESCRLLGGCAPELRRGIADLVALKALMVNLSYCQLKSIDEIGEALRRLTELRRLHLYFAGCSGQVTSLMALGQSLTQFRNLTELTVMLAWCPGITATGELGRNLGQLTTLRVLELNFSYCEVSSVEELGRSLECLTGLITLRLYLVEVSKRLTEVASLGKGLGKLKALRDLELNLKGNSGLTGIGELAVGLQRLTHAQLQRLCLDLRGCMGLDARIQMQFDLQSVWKLLASLGLQMPLVPATTALALPAVPGAMSRSMSMGAVTARLAALDKTRTMEGRGGKSGTSGASSQGLGKTMLALPSPLASSSSFALWHKQNTHEAMKQVTA